MSYMTKILPIVHFIEHQIKVENQEETWKLVNITNLCWPNGIFLYVSVEEQNATVNLTHGLQCSDQVRI